MKKTVMMLMLAAATLAAVANHVHDGKKGKKHAKAKKECCKASHASADGAVPACCKAKADAAKAANDATVKPCAGQTETKSCCKNAAGAQHQGCQHHKN